MSEFLLPEPNSYPSGLTAGPDGAVWFTERDNNGGKIGRIARTDEDSTEHIQATEEIPTTEEMPTTGDTRTFHWERWTLYLKILG